MTRFITASRQKSPASLGEESTRVSSATRGGRGFVEAMTDLLLQPTGDPDDYEVVVEGQVVGRIVLLAGAWSWAIDTAFRPGRHPVYGFEPTRSAATQAFARSWFQA